MNSENQVLKLQMEIQGLERSAQNIQNLLINYADELLRKFRKRRLSKENEPGKIETWFILRDTLPRLNAEAILKREEIKAITSKINSNTLNQS